MNFIQWYKATQLKGTLSPSFFPPVVPSAVVPPHPQTKKKERKRMAERKKNILLYNVSKLTLF